MKDQLKVKWILLCMTALKIAMAMADDTTQNSGTLSLEQAIQEGLGLSPTVQRYESARDEAKWGKLLGESALLPHVELIASHDFSAQYQSLPVALGKLAVSVPIVSPRTAYGAQASWTLFDGLANIKTFQASIDLSHAADLESSRKDFETRKKIEIAFFNALAAQKFEEVAEENVKTLEENHSQIQHRLENGVATQYDVLRVEVQLSDAKTELERTQDNVIIERKLLSQSMGKTQDDRPLSGVLPEPTFAKRVQSMSPPEPSQREDYEALALRSQAADKQASAAMGALVPKFGLDANYEKYDDTDYPNQASGGFRDAWNVGVFVSWSIFDGGATIAKAGAARAAAAKAEFEHQEAVIALPSDFELWRRRYIYSEHHFTAKTEDLKRSQESYRISLVSFQQGRNTITDVLQAQTDLFSSRAGVVQSQLDAQEALLNLELTIGKEI